MFGNSDSLIFSNEFAKIVSSEKLVVISVYGFLFVFKFKFDIVDSRMV